MQNLWQCQQWSSVKRSLVLLKNGIHCPKPWLYGQGITATRSSHDQLIWAARMFTMWSFLSWRKHHFQFDSFRPPTKRFEQLRNTRLDPLCTLHLSSHSIHNTAVGNLPLYFTFALQFVELCNFTSDGSHPQKEVRNLPPKTEGLSYEQLTAEYFRVSFDAFWMNL